MELTIKTFGQDKTGGKISVSDVSFNREFNEALVHQVVTAYLAGDRQGTVAQKTRAEVSGGGSKPFRQKGTGRARAGTIRSPLWRKGGIIFAARPRDYTQKVNKKMYRGAVCCILSELVRQDRFIVLNDLSMDAPKTRDFSEKLKALNVKSALIICDSIDENVYLSARNLRNINVVDVQGLNPVDMLKYENVLVTVAALKKVEELLG